MGTMRLDQINHKKASDRCKHGLGVGTCWLCQGHKPTPEYAKRDLIAVGSNPNGRPRRANLSLADNGLNFEEI